MTLSSVLPTRLRAPFLAALCALSLVACDGDTKDVAVGGSTSGGDDATNGDTGGGSGTGGTTSGGNGAYSLSAAQAGVAIVEGGSAVTVDLSIERLNGHSLPVALEASGATGDDARDLVASFSDDLLEAGETTAELRLELGIGVAPILPGTRTLRVVATDGSTTPVEHDLVIEVTPTDREDIYLLAGQSNMVGFSLPGSRESRPGEPDAPDARISQLNVTGNDATNFASPSDFTDPARVVADPPFTEALDPLHDGFESGIDGKPAEFIGPALSFAKAALPATTAQIVLVPTAWADTGFCKRDTNILPGLGWLAAPSADPAFAGTLLHDRAIARADYAIAETGGILRGILWHQGEADAGDPVCAAAYAANLEDMVASLRTKIEPDARGAAFRGPEAPIPFVVGTLSMGADARGSQVPFNDLAATVDAAHRGVASFLPRSGFVNNDDLVPPAYPCGEGSCVHFGAAAYREMGSRYFDVLQAIEVDAADGT